MFCYKCGTEIPDDSAFCHKCGAKMSAGNKGKEVSDSSSVLQKNGTLQEELRQDSDIPNERNIESIKDLQSKGDDFREFVNGYIRKNTAFQSAEELLNSKIPSRFVQICYGVPAVCMVYLIISLLYDAGFVENIIINILGIIFIAFIFGYLAVHLVGGIKKNKYATKFSGEIESNIEMDELIQFLNDKLAYLSPYFHEWGYLRQTMNLVVGGVSVAEMDITGNTEIALCTEFEEKKAFYSVIYIRPDLLAPDSGRRKYICNVKMRKADIRCGKYACIVKTAPILQAAIEYYLKEYRTKEEDFLSVSQNLKSEKITNNNAQKTSFNSIIPDEKKFGADIKPYYREQFERIASGQKPRFNWAAFFLNGWIQLYNGCTGIFCKTFLPLMIVLFMTSLIGLLGTVRFDFTLISISSVLGILVGIYSFILCIVNGFRFNKWYYQDVINNLGKRRSRKGFWILIAVQMMVIVFLLLIPDLIVATFYDPIDDLSVELSGEDLVSAQREDITVTEGYGSEKSVTADEAEEMINQWLSAHPIYPGYQSGLSPSIYGEKTDQDGNDSWMFELWVEGEEQADILVNKDDGDIIIEYLIWNENDRTFTRDQMPIDQWYSDIYLAETAERMNDGGYEGTAREIIMEWFSRHPLQHNYRIKFMNETVDTEDGSGIYLNYEMYWGDDEWYGTFYVNPDTGNIVMDSMIMATGPTSVQESMDQWYLEDYWFLGEDMGGYLEDYGDGIYGMYNSDETLVLEYYAEYDSYAICDYDGQCFIEYDDSSAASEVSIMDFAGTFVYDGSFEAEGIAVDFYYLLEIGEWDGYCFSINETWRGNTILQDEWARPKSLIVDTLIFDISSPDGAGYETHSLTYVPAKESSLGQDVIYLDGDDTMPFVRE